MPTGCRARNGDLSRDSQLLLGVRLYSGVFQFFTSLKVLVCVPFTMVEFERLKGEVILRSER